MLQKRCDGGISALVTARWQMRMTTFEFFKRTIIVAIVVIVPLLIWLLFEVVLVLVGSILICVLLQLVSEPFTRWCKLPRALALAISGLIIFGAFGGAGYLFGTQIGSELQDVVSRADTAINDITTSMQKSEFGKMLLSHLAGGNLSLTAFVSSAFSVSTTFIGGAVITVIAGFYFAAEPDVYRSGLGRFFPKRLRAEVYETTGDIAAALRLWLIGQLIQMLVIGMVSAFAVWQIGLQSPLALGVIAGMAEFIPYVGPIIASVPAVLVAATDGLHAVLWTIAAYLLIHQLEGEILAPLIQRRMVYIPPALMLLGIITISSAFGVAATIFAAPIVVIVFVAINKLYLREALGERVSLPGEQSGSLR
jgi:predicted PurR-regulated permease PerM